MPPRNFTDTEEAQIANLYRSGFSARAIARAYGFSHHISITSALRRQGVHKRHPSTQNRLYTLNPRAFDSIDNELAAYWWGFLYADGHIYRNTLTISLKWDDRAHLKKLRDFMQADSPIVEMDTPHYHNAKIEFSHRHLARRLLNLGVVVRRTIPEVIPANLPSRIIHHWIRGYFDGDGSARQDGSIVFCGCPKLLKWVREVMAFNANTNPDLSIQKHIKARLHYLYFSGRHVALRVAEYMYRDATIWLERKMDVIDSWPKPQVRERDAKGRYI